MNFLLNFLPLCLGLEEEEEEVQEEYWRLKSIRQSVASEMEVKDRMGEVLTLKPGARLLFPQILLCPDHQSGHWNKSNTVIQSRVMFIGVDRRKTLCNGE